MQRTWDVFCRVVDNYGDAAFAWRLSSALVAEHGASVRLFIDLPEALHALVPAVDPDVRAQRVAGVEVFTWDAETRWATPAAIVVDAFGCGLPDDYLAERVRSAADGLWITTEYLSAERWVCESHGLPSTHPRTGLRRFFFFPGFVEGTGGLPREAGYDARLAPMRTRAGRDAFWGSLGFAPPPEGETVVSLFGYENDRIPPLLAAWAEGAAPVTVAVTASRVRADVDPFVGRAPAVGETVRRGALTLRFLPFLDQPGYDLLLAACDWNFVRGEDSLVRAVWAGRPLVWHIYPQADLAHAAKLDAFLDWWLEGVPLEAGRAARGFAHLWNALGGASAEGIGPAWLRLIEAGAALPAAAAGRAAAARDAGEFVAQLVDFCELRLK